MAKESLVVWAEKEIAECTAEERELLFAFVSCPWNITIPTVKALADTMRWTYKATQPVLENLRAKGLVNADGTRLNDKYSWFYHHPMTLDPWVIVAALSLMKPADVVTEKYQRAYATDNEMALMRHSSEDYADTLLKAVSPDNASVSVPGVKAVMPTSVVEKLKEAWLYMMADTRWTSYLGTIPESGTAAMVESWPGFMYGGYAWERVEDGYRQFSRMRLFEADRIKINDWYAFMSFWHEGRPEHQLKKMRSDSPYHLLMQAVVLFEAGDTAAAVRTARKALKVRFYPMQRKYFTGVWENFLLGLMLYADRATPSTKKTLEVIFKNMAKLGRDEEMLGAFAVLAVTDEHDQWFRGFVEKFSDRRSVFAKAMIEIFAFAYHVDCLFGKTPTAQVEADIRTAQWDYPVLGQMWLAVTDPKSKNNEFFKNRLGMPSLLAPQERVELWEKALDALLAEAGGLANASESAAAASEGSSRVFYLVDTKYWRVQPRLQKLTKTGRWSAGRNIAIKTFGQKDVEGMTAQDEKVADLVEEQVFGWYGNREYVLPGPETVRALAGHPYVYNGDAVDQRLEIEKSDLQLSVKTDDGAFIVESNIDNENLYGEGRDQFVLKMPMPGKVEVIDVPTEKFRFIESLHKVGPMPEAARDKLTAVLEKLSAKIPVMSDLLKNASTLEKKKGDAKITVQISPDENRGYAVRAVVRPLEGSGVICAPGEGQEYLAAKADGTPVQVVRNLKKEKANFEALTKALDFLDENREDETHWSVSVEGCLELLNTVRERKDVVLEWPEGAKFRVSRPTVGFEAMKLSVGKIGNWFEVTGEVKLDGKTKLKMAEVLRLVREAKGNFIALGDNEYVALTESLKKQLAALDRLTTGTKNPQVSVFNADVISDFEKNGAQVEADKAFRTLTERIQKASDVTAPVPAGLTTELRDYQEDGFLWMTRLASWGAGAVLADDMGLGKTVQTITVLLSRAELGPQLVVVPASVLLNWRDELTRFAPGLKQVILNLADDRTEVLSEAKKGTVVVTTYGILTAEIETLAQKTWATAVFDEAHNIKNKETKSFKAATQVKADFRVMLTGTPLQNHLAEIWALFEIAVPGLLGSFTRFTDRFVISIERDKDREQQRLLKRIVSPFILRRTKTDVLSELPEKTEMTVKVELSSEEKALYEQLREETQESLASGEINPVQALASLMKLRQAACAAELVDPKLTLPSSKTQAFLKLTDELIENRHRALVFSQFTSHLALIRRALDEKGIKYLYLDGSMSPAQRMKLVETFENGDKPLFLISLKAGGTGLNLTAADYVIHMDPWWNPAIEDQASDRAYRIGQDRPVTIYRLIAAGTVEEKILKLHATKKSLADALLEGTEMSSRLGREEIMELLSLAR